MRRAPTIAFENGSKIVSQAKQATKPVVLHLPPMHPRQDEFCNCFDRDPHIRFAIGACGTKTGKTYGSSIRFVKEAWSNRNSLAWWIAPSYAQSKMAYGLVKRLLPKGSFEEYKADLRITLLEPDGSEHSVMEFKSAENEDNLRGFAVNFFVLDEAARCTHDAFVSVMTTVTQTMGRGIIISTPKGSGWFRDVYRRGEKDHLLPGEVDPFPEWLAYRLPTWTNPYVSTESVELMRRDLPEDVFRQEVAAQFLKDSAGVFRGVRDCVNGVLEPYNRASQYVMGVDLAKLRDFTTIFVMDRQRKHVCYFDRFNQLSWEVQKHRIIEVNRAYGGPPCFMDSTGAGDPIAEELGYVIPVVPYTIGGTRAKQQLIDKLRVDIEQQTLSYPEIPVVIRELEIYEYDISPSGVIKYSSPRGFHDDCVIGLALCNWGVQHAAWVYRNYSTRGF